MSLQDKNQALSQELAGVKAQYIALKINWDESQIKFQTVRHPP